MTLTKNVAYEVELPVGQQRYSIFLGSYDLDLRIKHCRIKIGRFSFGLINAIKLLPGREDDLVLDVGCFCEASLNAKLIVGGNHRNNNLFNSVLASGKIFLEFMDGANRDLCSVAASPPIVIGDNVVLSDGATVTPGSQIGAGSVIAAGAVVAGQLAPLGIYAGVPARLLRPRLTTELAALYELVPFGKVAAHSLPGLPVAMMRLQRGDISVEEFTSEVDFLAERPVIEIDAESRPGSDRGIQLGPIRGYRVGERSITEGVAVQKLNAYFAQIHSDQPKVKWIPDVFDALGLYD